MGRFGDSTGTPATAVTVTQSVNEGLAGRDLLVIGGLELTRTAPELFANAPIRAEGTRLRVMERNPLTRAFGLFSSTPSDPDNADVLLQTTDSFNGLVSFRSPFDSARTVVAAIGSDPRELPMLVQGLAERRINAQVQGDLAVTSGDGMRSFAVGSSYWAGSLPVWMRVAWWFSQRPLLMALGGILAALLLGGPLYLFFARQQRRRLKEAEGA
jgi:cellulose synthase (UDP-forming)